MACLTGTQPGLISLSHQQSGDADTDIADEKRKQGEAARDEQTCQRVSGEQQAKPNRASGEDRQPAHASAAMPGSRGSAAFAKGGGGTRAACA
jgi:hypothetical protein